MVKLNQKGNSSSALLIALAVLVVLLIGSFSFAVWAFASREDYKNNTDDKIAAAVKVAQQQTATAKDNQFAEISKSPLKTYKGPDTYGSVTVQYPKTWSGYVDQGNNIPLDAYFQPDIVPAANSKTPYALRIQVTSDSYAQELSQFSNNASTGNVKISAYRATKVPNTLGSKIEGQIGDSVQGTLVIFPLRDKALKVWSEAPQYSADYNNFVLPNLSFSP